MKILSAYAYFLLVALLAGCINETERDIDSSAGEGTDNDNNRREVTLILKNDLALRNLQVTKLGETSNQVVQAATKPAGVFTKTDAPIATADENAISSLDVYVFASETESGEYTFQERFAYRAEANATLPAGATQLKLTATTADNKETTGLLKLKKGLFVKLYCIANNTRLIDSEGNEVYDTAFRPLLFTQEGTGVHTQGEPTESQFISYHTPLLDPNQPADVLTTPLAMSGAYITPLDLTDFESSTRMQASFKLTRLAARFDIINNAEKSKFTIEAVSMAKARRGATFFPIRVYGDTPTAKDGELITCPQRAFDGENANLGIQTGAFYSYPSPKEDQAYLILKGTYQVNKTESKEVTYQVPFRTSSASGDGAYLEINNNHRYTLAITQADDYQLDFNLSVADWADDGSIDEYNPGTGTGQIDVKVPEGDTETQYDAENHIVTMSLNEGTNFEMIMEKTTAILPAMTKTYAGGLAAQEYDWLDITQPDLIESATSAKTDDRQADEGYKYTFALKDGYAKNRYPRAIVRFTDLTTAEETVLVVDALEPPRAMTTIQEGKNNHNTFDHQALEATVYRLVDSNLRIKLFCTAGVELGDWPAWLTPQLLSENSGESLYSFTLNDLEASPENNQGTVTFRNTKYPDKTVQVMVSLAVPDITPDFSQLGGDDNNSFTPADGATLANVSMRIADGNTFKFTSTSLQGIKIDMNFADGPAWLRHDGEIALTRAGNFPNTITFYLVKENLPGAKKTTVTLKNKTVGGGQDYVFTVTPDFVAPELTSEATMTLAADTSRKVPSIQITGNCYGGSTIVAEESPQWLTYETTSTTANTFTYKVSLVPGQDKTDFPTSLPSSQTITLASNINPEKKTIVTVNFTDMGWVEEEINQDEIYSNGNKPKTEYRVKTAGKTLTLTVYTMFDTPTVQTAYASGYGTNISWLPAPTAPKTSGYGDNRKKFTYQIVVPPSSGTDAAYQLHQGTITVKQATTELKKITLWRGASNVPFPSKRNDNPYYSAVLKGGLWWAPLNLGANQIAINATAVSSIGNLYQWGRNVPTTYNSNNKTPGPTTNANATDEGITSSAADNWDWLKPKNDYLWRDASGRKTGKDPCPAGWRIPTSDELNNWGSGTYANSILTIAGENYISLVLPAAGTRNGNCDPHSQGAYGYYWSSTPSGTRALYARTDGSAASVISSGRVDAFSVRCIKE